jgi:CheY-like chemotaxis protein
MSKAARRSYQMKLKRIGNKGKRGEPAIIRALHQKLYAALWNMQWGVHPIDGPKQRTYVSLDTNVYSVSASMKRIKVLIADDNGLIRKEFRKILELEDDLDVVGEAIDGLQAVVMVKKFLPAVVLMDVAMPLLNGLQATLRILKAFPGTKVLIFSAHNDEAYIAGAINSGAMGYLIKQTCADNVCHAIREVRNGNIFFSPSIPKHFHQRKRKK